MFNKIDKTIIAIICLPYVCIRQVWLVGHLRQLQYISYTSKYKKIVVILISFYCVIFVKKYSV